MSNKAKIKIPQKKIEAFCRKWQITELSLFGSVLRADFRPDSDIDVLVTFAPEAHHTLFDIVRMQDELTVVFERDIDIVEKGAVIKSKNYIRRKNILGSTEVLYVA